MIFGPPNGWWENGSSIVMWMHRYLPNASTTLWSLDSGTPAMYFHWSLVTSFAKPFIRERSAALVASARLASAHCKIG